MRPGAATFRTFALSAINVLEHRYIRHEPIKKLKPLCTIHTHKLRQSIGTHQVLFVKLIAIIIVVARLWRKRSECLACATTVAACALKVYCKF